MPFGRASIFLREGEKVQDEQQNVLYQAAAVWKDLMNYRYILTYGCRNKSYEINLTFSADEFSHLAGFQYLKDISLPRYNSRKIVDMILSGKITYKAIQKGMQYREMVEPRLLALVRLKEVLEQDFELSLLAILLYEMKDKSNAFGRDNVTENFNTVLREFRGLSCAVSMGNKSWEGLSSKLQVLKRPLQGHLSLRRETELDYASDFFTQLFTSVDLSVRKIFYKKEFHDDEIYYKLIEEKYIAGNYRRIDFERESAGNCQLLNISCYLLTACMGGVVILDEAEANIHDLLFQKLLEEIRPILKGQVIMTTHNTMLMEASFAREATYILSVDPDNPSDKKIRCISDYRKRTYAANNIRNKYLNCEYGGVPELRQTEFQESIEKICNE